MWGEGDWTQNLGLLNLNGNHPSDIQIIILSLFHKKNIRSASPIDHDRRPPTTTMMNDEK